MADCFSLGVRAPGELEFFDLDQPELRDGGVAVRTLFSGFSAGTELTYVKGTDPGFTARRDPELGIFVPGRRQSPLSGGLDGLHGSRRSRRESPCGSRRRRHRGGRLRTPLLACPGAIGRRRPGPRGCRSAARDLPRPDGAHLRQLASPRRCRVRRSRRLEPRRWRARSLRAGDRRRRGGRPHRALRPPPRRERGGARRPDPQRLATAAALGITTLDEAATESWRWCKERWVHEVGDRGADLVFQCRGRAAVLHEALRSLRPQGVVIDLAFYQGGATGLRLGEELHHNGLTIRCAQIGRVPRGLSDRWDRRRLAEETGHLLAAHGDRIRQHLITDVVPVRSAPSVIAALARRERSAVQVVFSFDTPGPDD